MSAQHTPGPWCADGPPWNMIVWAGGENRIAWLAHSNGLDDAMDLANARLIAAAPDLLAALESARETILHLIHMRGSEAEGTDADWTAEIDAAIAKAKGGAQ